MKLFSAMELGNAIEQTPPKNSGNRVDKYSGTPSTGLFWVKRFRSSNPQGFVYQAIGTLLAQACGAAVPKSFGYFLDPDRGGYADKCWVSSDAGSILRINERKMPWFADHPDLPLLAALSALGANDDMLDLCQVEPRGLTSRLTAIDFDGWFRRHDWRESANDVVHDVLGSFTLGFNCANSLLVLGKWRDHAYDLESVCSHVAQIRKVLDDELGDAIFSEVNELAIVAPTELDELKTILTSRAASLDDKIRERYPLTQ